MKGSQNNSSKRRSGSRRAPHPESQNRLKSERVQLELEAANRVRKIVQRGAFGRFVQPLVLPAELPGFQVAVAIEAGASVVGEVVVTASLLPADPDTAGDLAAEGKEVAGAAA